jgi:hypothetical protein
MVTLEEGGAVTVKIIDLGLAKSLDQPALASSAPEARINRKYRNCLRSL